MTWSRDKFHAEIQQSGVLAPDYAEDILVRLAHHSSAIEGNTLTLSETVTLLVDERTPAAGTPIRELYEVANHRQALSRILQAISSNENLSTTLVLDIHRALMDHLVHDFGQFKSSDNIVAGASWKPSPPSQVPGLIHQWADQTEWQIANLDGQNLLEAIAESHITFERIHPFSDGNGRTGRALIAFQTIRRFGFPAIINLEQRSSYITMLDKRNADGLATLLATNLANESERHIKNTI